MISSIYKVQITTWLIVKYFFFKCRARPIIVSIFVNDYYVLFVDNKRNQLAKQPRRNGSVLSTRQQDGWELQYARSWPGLECGLAHEGHHCRQLTQLIVPLVIWINKQMSFTGNHCALHISCPIRIIVRMPEPDCILPYRMRCNAEFYYVGKIPRIGIGRPSLQRRVVLKWFYPPRAVGTTLSEVHALHRVPASTLCLKKPLRLIWHNFINSQRSLTIFCTQRPCLILN